MNFSTNKDIFFLPPADKQLPCVGFLQNVIILHILKLDRAAGDRVIAYWPQHQISFRSNVSSQNLLPTSALNQPRSQRSFSRHLSIPNGLPAWLSGQFSLMWTRNTSLKIFSSISRLLSWAALHLCVFFLLTGNGENAPCRAAITNQTKQMTWVCSTPFLVILYRCVIGRWSTWALACNQQNTTQCDKADNNSHNCKYDHSSPKG